MHLASVLIVPTAVVGMVAGAIVVRVIQPLPAAPPQPVAVVCLDPPAPAVDTRMPSATVYKPVPRP